MHIKLTLDRLLFRPILTALNTSVVISVKPGIKEKTIKTLERNGFFFIDNGDTLLVNTDKNVLPKDDFIFWSLELIKINESKLELMRKYKTSAEALVKHQKGTKINENE